MKKILAIAMAALTLLAVGCSKPAEEVITIETVNTPAPVVTPNVPEVTPTPEVFVPSYTEKIAAKKAKNDETIGWIAIPGTVIDFPIMFDTKGGLGYYKLCGHCRRGFRVQVLQQQGFYARHIPLPHQGILPPVVSLHGRYCGEVHPDFHVCGLSWQ